MIASGPDNRTAIALTGFESASEFWIGSSPQWARLDLETGDVVTVRDVGFDAGTVEVSPDGTHVALGGRAGELMVLDLATDQPVREPVTVHDIVVDVTYSEDGSRLLTSGFDYKNALWDGRTGELLARVVTSQLVTEATFTGDGDTVLIAPLWAGAVFEWDTRPRPLPSSSPAESPAATSPRPSGLSTSATGPIRRCVPEPRSRAPEHPQRDSNPCYRRERAGSWAARRWGPERGKA